MKDTKAFFNAIYAFLDELVLLASEVLEKPPSNVEVIPPAEGAVEMRLQELVDLKDGVRLLSFWRFFGYGCRKTKRIR